VAAPSLDSPRAKLDRAREHLEALDEKTAAFFADEPYKIGSEFRPDTSEYVFWIEPTRQPPAELGLILGEYAHNLRSALDHLVCQLALLAGAPCETTQFPICSTPADFQRREPKWLAGLSAHHRATIERTQPYHAGALAHRHFLVIVDWLDNVDKHRVIHPAFGYFCDPGRQPRLTFTPNRQAGVIRHRMVANGRRIKGKTEIVYLKLAPLGTNPRVEMHGQLTFEPAFGERWFRGTELPKLLRATQQVIDLFAAEFP
jgi:hypothetical protein